MSRRPYRSNISDAQWAFVAPYLSLLPHTVAQRRHDLRVVVNAQDGPIGSGVADAAGPRPTVGCGLSTAAPVDRCQRFCGPCA
jgi:hypothetical protein